MKFKTRTLKKGLAFESPKWNLGYLEIAKKEAEKFLNNEQYFHAVHLFEDIANEKNPTKSATQDIREIEDFYELRDKGGVLGNINLRVYFTILEERKLILILSTYKKEDDDQVPKHIKIRVRNRLRIAKGEILGNKRKG